MEALLTTHLPHLPPPRKGKVREVYDLGDELLIVSTDRISAFDVVMANGVPGKGRLLNQMSTFWFQKLASMTPNHLRVTQDAEIAQRVGHHPELRGRSVIARKASPLAIECVVRGYLAGSLFKEYAKNGSSVYGLTLPDGMVEGQQLPTPLFTPATKAEEGHDENISFDQAADIVGKEVANHVRQTSLKLYEAAAAHAATVGLILADTKFEFGLTDEGCIWIDEALTPDSSRYWEATQYKPGGSQPGFDKQFVRDYLLASGWDQSPPGPTLPENVINQTQAKYLSAFERITGSPLDLG
ncbi:MAG: phosphoribosylaminoimidazolesuccinocarboxamide synthase [Fimbriimonadaceae bacterium]|jgi:phosphoribosylaminoimidazole-succinocarboxamide synthase|nr:phosphoribosylaminoimidazolesuccinocarboxamide synthase [Fimbriimonadaceae bacterium]